VLALLPGAGLSVLPRDRVLTLRAEQRPGGLRPAAYALLGAMRPHPCGILSAALLLRTAALQSIGYFYQKLKTDRSACRILGLGQSGRFCQVPHRVRAAHGDGSAAPAGAAPASESGPYWSLMFEVCESALKPVGQQARPLGGRAWPAVVAETLAGALATRMLAAGDQIVSIYHRRAPVIGISQSQLTGTWVLLQRRTVVDAHVHVITAYARPEALQAVRSQQPLHAANACLISCQHDLC